MGIQKKKKKKKKKKKNLLTKQSTSATSLPLTAEQENRFLEVVCKVVKDRSASVAQKAQNMLGPLVVRLRPSSVHMLLKVLVQLVIEEVCCCCCYCCVNC